MGKMQNVSFRTIEDFLDHLPDDQLAVVVHLRALVKEMLTGCREKLSYNVPFYSRNKTICYIWPSAVPWGKVKMNGVSMGFVQGHLLPDEDGYLDKGTRKYVRTRTFYTLNDIDNGLLRFFLMEALEIDHRFSRK